MSLQESVGAHSRIASTQHTARCLRALHVKHQRIYGRCAVMLAAARCVEEHRRRVCDFSRTVHVVQQTNGTVQVIRAYINALCTTAVHAFAPT